MAGQGPLSNQTLDGKYLLGDLLGGGAFGEVYIARHSLLEDEQAVKVLQGHLFRKEAFRERFLREARIQRKLTHPHIVHVDDCGIDGDRAYLVLTLATGGTLKDALEKHSGPLGLDSVRRYLEDICSALDYAHSKEVVHLDLKPNNLLLDENGRVLLSDFGLAHLITQGKVEAKESANWGTPYYMAPEHISGKPERRSDLYALGVILYQLLTGQVPFEGPPEIVSYKHLHESPPPLHSHRSGLPDELEQVLQKALAKNPDDRYRTAGELLKAFNDVCFPLFEGESYYPAHVAQAFREQYISLGGATGGLRVPKPVTAEDARQRTSERGTPGYGRPFSKGWLYWCERGGAQPVWWGINELYGRLGRCEGRLGFPLTGEIKAATSPQGTTGVYQRFEERADCPEDVRPFPVRYGASIYWSKPYKAHATWGGIGICYERLGGTKSMLGFPTFPELEAAPSPRGTTGWYQHFEGGLIVCAKECDALPVVGGILDRYNSLAGSGGPLGFPVSAEIQAAPSPQGTTGVVQRFEARWDYPEDVDTQVHCGASVYWCEKYGAQPTWGGIGICYERLGGTSGPLGFPLSPELEAAPSPQGTTGVYQRFEGGEVYWCEKYDAKPVVGAILAAFQQMGGTGGRFGFPIAPAIPASDNAHARIQEFEGGIIYAKE